MPPVSRVAAVGTGGALAEDGPVPVVSAHAAVVRAAEARMVEASFCSSGQALRWKTRFRLSNAQHLALERCHVGIQVVQSTGSLISSSDDQV